MSELHAEFRRLQSLDSASAAEKRRRGFAFEKLLKAILDSEAFSPRLRIRPSGEEIDGSVCFDGRFLLLEAKWHADSLPASSIYAFKGKVDGKLTGTIGLFISMSGYSDDAVDALTAGKNVNVILFDQNDVEAFFAHSFRDVLLAKLRAAAEEGVVFYPFTSTITEVDDAVQRDPVRIPTETETTSKQIIVVCEGQGDVEILRVFSERILAAEKLEGHIRFVSAQGKHGIPRLINTIQPMFSADTPLVVVVDGDSEVEATRNRIEAETTVPITSLVIIEPEIEVWAAPGHDRPRRELVERARDAKQTTHMYFQQLAASLPLDTLRSTDRSFDAFYRAIIDAASSNDA